MQVQFGFTSIPYDDIAGFLPSLNPTASCVVRFHHGGEMYIPVPLAEALAIYLTASITLRRQGLIS